MSTTPTPASPYLLGHSPDEIRRLDMQADLLDPVTRGLFVQAGVEPGMRVLELGAGAGAVTKLTAELVGPTGSVTSVEANAGVIGTARSRIEAAGLGNVTFVNADMTDPDLPYRLDDEYDALVCRCALSFVREPVPVLRRLAALVRPHGVVAFHEPAYLPPAALPASPILQQIWQWIQATYEREQLDLLAGLRLHRVFGAAGLPDPTMRVDAYMGGGRDWTGYEVMADLVRSMLPRMVRHGVATEEQVDVDTLADRLRAETLAQDGVLVGWAFVTAWSRRDGRVAA
jgi:ubiquinone/menaquinone biosynthesis C-methylase UbiE